MVNLFGSGCGLPAKSAAPRTMTLERVRKICLAHPGATEQIQWGADLVFKVGGKMFCVACTEIAPVVTRPFAFEGRRRSVASVACGPAVARR